MEGHRFRTTLLSGFAVIALLAGGARRLRRAGILRVAALARARHPPRAGRPSDGTLPAGRRSGPQAGRRRRLVGLAGAVALTRLMRTLLFGVDAIDPRTYASAVAALGVVASSGVGHPGLKGHAGGPTRCAQR